MPPPKPLPLHPAWDSVEDYIESLLRFVTSTDLFRNLCGGVHVLDFLTREPAIYAAVLSQSWRDWFELVDIHDFLDLLLREDLTQLREEGTKPWRSYPAPPPDFLQYIHTVRIHCLSRDFRPVSPDITPLPRRIAVGMNQKKIHEVVNFAAYVDQLASFLSRTGESPSSIIDFGSGQNYLGRTLACPPYNKHIVAIEQRHHNVEGARGMDIHAKLTEKKKVIRNKKAIKRQNALMREAGTSQTPPLELEEQAQRLEVSDGYEGFEMSTTETPFTKTPTAAMPTIETMSGYATPTEPPTDAPKDSNKGAITYIEHALESGHLENILRTDGHLCNPDDCASSPIQSLVVSIHSCGNLTHHGIRSLTLNPSVNAVAMIGCCYNLLTERLGPATYKLPQLRPNHPRLIATGSTYDPHGFPMSRRFENFEFDTRVDSAGAVKREKGLRLNITARMMAVQAPYNWGREDTDAFITRHFYRALFQRVLLDRGVVKQASSADDVEVAGGSLSGKDTQGTPLIIGSLRKSAFVDFHAYVKAAREKLTTGNPNVEEGERIASLTTDLVTDYKMVAGYREKYDYARKQLGMIWSLMAFSAGVVESAIAVDRWLWLKEQPEVGEAWVETVFDYVQSPRNLCVVGIKKPGALK